MTHLKTNSGFINSTDCTFLTTCQRLLVIPSVPQAVQ